MVAVFVFEDETMTSNNAFSLVKAAVASAADAILSEHGVKHNREAPLRGEWTTGFLCPFCSDKSGSASFTQSLFLKCHQCSYKGDVFEWIAKHLGKTQWDVCKQLADRLKVNIAPVGTRTTGKAMPPRMTEAILAYAIRDLWDSPHAAMARSILADRKIDDQQLLMKLEVGWINGWIIFSRREENGKLEERYRGWAPKDKVKWRWFGSGSGGPGIWPSLPCTADKVWLAEGEGDALAAMARLRLHEIGWHVATWTAGATSSPKTKDVPQGFHGKEIHIAYDNDVFQGPDYGGYFVQAKPGKLPNDARIGAEHRLKNLLNKLCPTFEALHCKVFVRQCPVDPKVNYGGDLRDWVDAGGSDLTDWPSFRFDELPDFAKPTTNVQFDDVFSMLGKGVRTITQVDMVGRDDVVVPTVVKMECELGQNPACSLCPGYRDFPDGTINLSDYSRERLVGIESGFPNEYIIKHIVQKPRSCPRLEIVVVESVVGSEWQGIRPGHTDLTTQRMLKIISTDPPSLSGEVEVTGLVHADAKGKSVLMFAEKCTSLDKTEVDLSSYLADFRASLPCLTTKPEVIDEYLARRWRDLAYNVTRIHGRMDIQIAHDLLAHSAIDFKVDGAQQRAWLDICVYGETRSGKSLTFRRMFEHHQLGVYHTAVSNVSRAGLVMGADKNGMLKPGLLPKCHRKMLMMDEWHFLCQQRLSDHPMSWMQSSRDEGKVSGVKIYGARDLPAKVRFCAIANWMRNKRRTFEHPCEHLGALYGSPETLARLDFGLAVGPNPTQQHLDEAEHFWTAARTRALILRAWSQEANQIFIDDDAVDLAKKLASDWQDKYESESLPLFTPEEKPVSIMRIATALANLTFGYWKDDFYSAHVRKVHVEWSANWLRHVWSESGYDRYSQARIASNRIELKFEAEKMLTVNLGLQDPNIADIVLSQFLEPFSLQELIAIIGKEHFEVTKWIARMQALRVFERVKNPLNTYTVSFSTTKGGDHMILNLLAYARHDHDQWIDRYNRISIWLGPADPDNMVPMTAETWELLDDGNPDRQKVPF